MQTSLASENQTAAILLACAVVELFPNALLVHGQGTPERFYYDFIFPFTFQPDFLPLIEERMRLIIKEKREVNLLEMMPSNAANMMRYRGQPLAAALLEGVEKALIEVCQIGNFSAYSPRPFLRELALPHIKLFESFIIGDLKKNEVRIVGAASLEKNLLKKMAKQLAVSARSHEVLGQKMQLWEPLEEGLWLWSLRGEAVRNHLISIWKSHCASQGFQFIATPTAFLEEGSERNVTKAHCKYFLKKGVTKTAEVALVSPMQQIDSCGLFSSRAYFTDIAHVFCSDEKLLEECISSLQFICKIPKILGFEFEIVLSVSTEDSQKAKSKSVALFRQALDKVGLAYTVERSFQPGILASIDVRIPDALGRRWTGPYLRIAESPGLEKGSNALILSAFGSLERVVALLLEQKSGWFPLLIAPEQVRILVANSNSFSYAKRILAELQGENGFRSTLEGSKELLKVKVHRAMLERVPYVLLLGEREEKANLLTVRAYGQSKEQFLSLDEFCKRLKSEMGSYSSELKN